MRWGCAMRGVMDQVARVQVDLYGSLALTGMGHATDRAVLLGLAGNEPATIDPATIEADGGADSAERIGLILREGEIEFDEARDLLFRREMMVPPGAKMQHPNGLRLTAYDAAGALQSSSERFSPLAAGSLWRTESDPQATRKTGRQVPFPFHTAHDC